ncbi:uncharacterized protein B0J16DRAFT_378727 [Fusarium flagelliforme]|uniref:uncharacterized protein n=1 Tax=Fusarium flagelliforme TaxID=2675880 RepID=UPI001E8D970D|nr:uncharacterized protein B0J16DRAFT_378727 [Fusarium flagelliforme]KAH7198291.1 hypothetical protein B0J16DRAFT_378727 [Fusarium flagelliforme]
MSSPPEYRRPHDPATSERQQRSALCGEPVGGHACSSVISTLKLSLVEPCLVWTESRQLEHSAHCIASPRKSPDTTTTKSDSSNLKTCAARASLPTLPLLRCLPSFLERDAIEGESPGASFTFTFL